MKDSSLTANMISHHLPVLTGHLAPTGHCTTSAPSPILTETPAIGELLASHSSAISTPTVGTPTSPQTLASSGNISDDSGDEVSTDSAAPSSTDWEAARRPVARLIAQLLLNRQETAQPNG